MAIPPSLPQWLRDQLLPFSLPVFLFLTVVFLLFLINSKPKPSNLPASPPKFPIIGNLHQLGALPHRTLDSLSKTYGPLMLLHMGCTPTLVVSSADFAKEIMTTHEAVFSNRPITSATKAFVYGCRDLAFSPYGEYWRQVRKICVLDLLSVKRVRSYKFVREEEIAGMVSLLNEASPVQKPVNLNRLLVTVTNNIISRISLGRKLEEGSGVKRDLVALLKQLMDYFGMFSMEDMFPSLGWIDVVTGLRSRMNSTSKAFHDFLDEVIEEHIVDKKGDDKYGEKDFVHILLECQKDLSLTLGMSRDYLRSIILDMVVGGTDAICATVEWAMIELLKHPKLMQKVQNEVRQVVGKKSLVNENDINQMEYLNCIVKETLRLHPPLVLSLPRVSNAPAKIGTYSIPAHTRIIVNEWTIMRDPKYWDKPDEFIPERFINSDIHFQGAEHQFIPFGAGRRSCPGTAFAVASIDTVLANLLYWFEWELPPGTNKDEIDTEAFGLSVHLKNPLTLFNLLLQCDPLVLCLHEFGCNSNEACMVHNLVKQDCE